MTVEVAEVEILGGSIALAAKNVNHSGTIASGGAAQDLFPANPNRKGWRIQNKSSGIISVRDKGADGSLDATSDELSLDIPIGSYYEPPYTSLNAHSVIGDTTDQAFFCEEW